MIRQTKTSVQMTPKKRLCVVGYACSANKTIEPHIIRTPNQTESFFIRVVSKDLASVLCSLENIGVFTEISSLIFLR